MNHDDDLLNEFIAEAGEHLDQAEERLLALAADPDDREAVQGCFRNLHTIKGCAGFFDFVRVQALAHKLESLLDRLREGQLASTAELSELLLAGVSRLRAIIAAQAAGGAEPEPRDDADLGARLAAVDGGSAPAVAAPTPAPAAADGALLEAASAPLARLLATSAADVAGLRATIAALLPIAAEWPLPAQAGFEALRDFVDRLVLGMAGDAAAAESELAALVERLAAMLGEDAAPAEPEPGDADYAAETAAALDAAQLALARGDAAGAADQLASVAGMAAWRGDTAAAETARAAAAAIAAGDGGALAGARARLAGTPEPAPRVPDAPPAKTEGGAEEGDARANNGDGFTRVSTGKLEDLVNLVGELLISQAMVAQDADLTRLPRLQQAVNRQTRILRDLQVLSLSLRMVPLRGTFRKMSRAVFDTARKLGKQVDFVLVGDETELDRSIAEALADPLLHMVRNAIDHALEPEAERLAAGKPAHGKVRLAAAQSGDYVIITLSDDGRGLDPERLRRKAVERGLVRPDQVLSVAECHQLIFLAGFSTAATITSVSGRGVGMDVVRRNVEQLKGSVDIASEVGKGTTFTIRLPLTTAILDAMLLQVGAERFLVPLSAVVEATRPALGQVQRVGNARVVPSRGQLLPVLGLADLFAVPAAEREPERGILLVLEHLGGRFALQVDRIVGQQQVVIKPLAKDMAHHPGLTGSAILGDGRVALILDPHRLVAADAA